MATKKNEPSQKQQRMVSKEDEPSKGHQGDAAVVASPGPLPQAPLTPKSRVRNSVLKSGPLFLSTKGIGWTSWKKRWFILTQTSLVFFKSDPSAIPQKENEVNLILGGIDLNNSGSVVVKADKKLLTVLFQDGQDGRTFTLKAESLKDLYEWKAAFENALSQAPSSAHVLGKNDILGNEKANTVNGSKDPVNNKQPVRSTVLGKPILLALEDVDGAPTFLEKALRFIEEHGTKAEGVLRLAADVEDVKCRIQEYEKGKTEFSPEEDPHVIADCIKYVIRELPSCPVPASCCNALLEAYRTLGGDRVNTMREAVLDAFPEPNRRLLQRILMMMQAVASNKTLNRMSSSAVAACMAPLILRPLVSGDCEIENNFNAGDDSSIQLLRAAAAANHAQAIVITLLEEYDKIFGDSDYSSSSSEPSIVDGDLKATKKLSSSLHSSQSENDLQRSEDNQSNNSSAIEANMFAEFGHRAKRPTVWGWAIAKKKLPMEPVHFPSKEESYVSRLVEELHRERDKRTALEAGLNPSQGTVTLLNTVDEKIKADIKDIVQAEADINDLNKKVDELWMQLNQLLEQNSVSMNDRSNRHQPNHQEKRKDKPKDIEATFKKSGSKDKYADKVECENKKQEPSLTNKQNINGMHAAELVARKPLASSNVDKSTIKGENNLQYTLELITRKNPKKLRKECFAINFTKGVSNDYSSINMFAYINTKFYRKLFARRHTVYIYYIQQCDPWEMIKKVFVLQTKIMIKIVLGGFNNEIKDEKNEKMNTKIFLRSLTSIYAIKIKGKKKILWIVGSIFSLGSEISLHQILYLRNNVPNIFNSWEKKKKFTNGCFYEINNHAIIIEFFDLHVLILGLPTCGCSTSLVK
ncbi:rho GTPase-activating protein REN1-like isoform X2 [Gossypium australe]|uniref:Rho GTPase-activating protein REN1-like isoform X2 n=1 Tax=Gossypium australe TaxID=47621 RepID=A0A5B6WTV9_9ROSI|nr:rho GTPase-activating protein REN1-like isoform X2 [Gossypium australe]